MHDLITRIIRESAPGVHVLHRLTHDRAAMIAIIMIIIVIAAAALSPWLAPHNPVRQFAGNRLASPQISFPLGTDQLGRCVLSRLLWGARASMGVALIVVAAAVILGVPLGLISGYLGGLVDEIIMRIVDILLSFPGIIFAIVTVGVLGPSLLSVMIGLALVHWTSYARVVRGSVLEIKELLFVEAAEAIGASRSRIMLYHILPHCMGPVLVMATLGMGHVMLAAAAMSFLGLGAQPPTPEWGAMLNGARDFIRVAPALMVPPGIAIMITVLSFNIVGDALQDSIEPNGV